MLALVSLAFASPWILAALAALPVIWWLLRVTPPAPRQIAFPAVRLLLGLVPREPAPALAPVRAADARAAVEALSPKPWPGDRQAALARLQAMPLPQGSMAVWLSDGVEDGAARALADYLAERGSLRYIAAAPADAPRLLAADAAAAELAGKDLGVVVRSLPAAAPRPIAVRANGEDGALLAREAATIAPDDSSVAIRLPLPTELRNRVARIEVEGEESAGGVLLVDERWRRRPVGIAAASSPAGQP